MLKNIYATDLLNNFVLKSSKSSTYSLHKNVQFEQSVRSRDYHRTLANDLADAAVLHQKDIDAALQASELST